MESLKASDLRIGNYLQDRKGQYCLVERIEADIEDCKIPAIDVSTTYLPHEGIPISPDILVKCDIPTSYIEQDFNFRLCSDDWGYIVNVKGVDIAHIRFLHQLQNLHYYIKGHELEINL